MHGKLYYAGDINGDTELYRYMSLNQFISFIELEEIYLTNVTKWEDTWEAPLRFIPRKSSSGKIEEPMFDISETLYAQCWSKFKDSDALWRIYCKKNDGIVVKTSAKKFELIENFIRGFLAEVKYYKDDNLLEEIKRLQDDKSYFMVGEACLKREFFAHESEVRFIVNQQDHSDNFPFRCNVLNFKINVIDFIEGIYIDPRSEEWFVKTIREYCKRKGLSITSVKSELYEPNVFQKNKFYGEYVPIE